MEYFSALSDKLLSYNHLGTTTLSNGTRLIGKVPHVGPNAFLHKIYAPLTQPEIEQLSSTLQKSLPSEYVTFLGMANGMNVFSDTLAMYGMRHNYRRTGEDIYQPYDLSIPNTKERVPDSEPGYFYIGSYSYDGSKLYVDNDTGIVYRCDRGSSMSLNQWRSLADLLQSEIDRIGALFDSSGRKLDPKTPTVPSRRR